MYADIDDDAPVVMVEVEGDGAVVVVSAAVVDDDDAPVAIVDVEHDAAILGDEDAGAGCRLTHIRVTTPEVLAS